MDSLRLLFATLFPEQHAILVLGDGSIHSNLTSGPQLTDCPQEQDAQTVLLASGAGLPGSAPGPL